MVGQTLDEKRIDARGPQVGDVGASQVAGRAPCDAGLEDAMPLQRIGQCLAARRDRRVEYRPALFRHTLRTTCCCTRPATAPSRGCASTAATWTTDPLLKVCRVCHWASPEDYEHIALELVRRLDIVWQSGEVPDHERLAALAAQARRELPDFVKDVLRGATRRAQDSGEVDGMAGSGLGNPLARKMPMTVRNQYQRD